MPEIVNTVYNHGLHKSNSQVNRCLRAGYCAKNSNQFSNQIVEPTLFRSVCCAQRTDRCDS